MGTNSVPAPPTRDLDSPGEVAEMVRRFYADVAQDQILGPVFNETVDLGWKGPNVDRVKNLAHNVAKVHSKQLLGEAVVLADQADCAGIATVERS